MSEEIERENKIINDLLSLVKMVQDREYNEYKVRKYERTDEKDIKRDCVRLRLQEISNWSMKVSSGDDRGR